MSVITTKGNPVPVASHFWFLPLLRLPTISWFLWLWLSCSLHTRKTRPQLQLSDSAPLGWHIVKVHPQSQHESVLHPILWLSRTPLQG